MESPDMYPETLLLLLNPFGVFAINGGISWEEEINFSKFLILFSIKSI